MSKTGKSVVLDHSYDGIQEYDNPTPGWWWMIFHATVVFSLCYFLFFTFSPDAWTNASSFDTHLADNLRKQFAEIGTLKPDEPTILKYMNDPKWLAVGKTTFAARCAVCHRADAGGQTGPNMTDDYYKNIKKLGDIPTVIMNGAANGAMPSWRNQLHPNEITLTAAYIATLRGTHVAGGKAPEGDLAAPWPKP